MPLQLDKLNALVDGLSNLSPIDMWPVQNTASFELIPGKTPLEPGHRNFYRHYRDAGNFPGAGPGITTKEILTRLYKAIGRVVTPIL